MVFVTDPAQRPTPGGPSSTAVGRVRASGRGRGRRPPASAPGRRSGSRRSRPRTPARRPESGRIRVGGVEPGQELAHHNRDELGRAVKRIGGEDLGEVAAVDVVHHEIVMPIRVSDTKDGHDVGMP